jgi:hypothetical protein
MASLIKRNDTFYLQWRVGAKIRRRSLHTAVLQLPGGRSNKCVRWSDSAFVNPRSDLATSRGSATESPRAVANRCPFGRATIPELGPSHRDLPAGRALGACSENVNGRRAIV